MKRSSKRVPGWDKVIAEAQKLTHETIGGKRYERIKYGLDDPDGKDTCRDCGVEHGQHHVFNCSVERCPVCGDGQALSCSCYDASEAPTQ